MTAVLVVGMHRSGTSCLTGCLQRAGLELGEVITWAPFNLRGNRESRVVMGLNEEVLRESGGAWDDPPEAVAWSEQTRARRDGYIDSMSIHARWGFKDPRTLLTLDGWIEALPDASTVGTYRHPEAVSRSLASRSGMERAKAMKLWLAYNTRLLHLHRSSGTPIVCFDWERDRYLESVARLARSLGLCAPDDVGDFYDAGLRNQMVSCDEELPKDVSALLHELDRSAARP